MTPDDAARAWRVDDATVRRPSTADASSGDGETGADLPVLSVTKTRGSMLAKRALRQAVARRESREAIECARRGRFAWRIRCFSGMASIGRQRRCRRRCSSVPTIACTSSPISLLRLHACVVLNSEHASPRDTRRRTNGTQRQPRSLVAGLAAHPVHASPSARAAEDRGDPVGGGRGHREDRGRDREPSDR